MQFRLNHDNFNFLKRDWLHTLLYFALMLIYKVVIGQCTGTCNWTLMQDIKMPLNTLRKDTVGPNNFLNMPVDWLLMFV